MSQPQFYRKRKLTDKSIPNALSQLPEFAQESKMYQDLLEMERKLDWTMSRKRVEVQDALARTPTTTRTLRVFISQTVSGQAWQVGETDGEGEAVNFETGQGIPAWSLKVEGRLLEVPNQRSRDKVAPRKFSTFIKRMIVDLDRDPTLYPDGNIVEWPRPQGVHPPLDGFTIRRTGDQPTRVRIIIHLEQSPEQYKLSPELGKTRVTFVLAVQLPDRGATANILGIKEESRIGVVQALWNYIKINGLQDKVDRRKIRPDDYLRPIFAGDSIAFQQLPELRASAWDIEIKMEDTSLKNRMAVIVQSSKESLQDLSKLDDERVFLQSFADDPAKFIHTWLESQSRDLESILGSGPSEGATIRTEELRRSDFFRLLGLRRLLQFKKVWGSILQYKAVELTDDCCQLGKLRQWAGEKISTRDKTIVVDELKELEQDVELRKQGIIRLQAASEDYYHVLSKKKESPASGEAEELMPLDALGIVMVTHGTSLVKLGRAQCKIATLQEAYALTFQDTFITSCEKLGQDIKDYEYQRKKLDSRRLSYDAAISKLEKIKSSKKEKEKERREAEDELQRCRLRFEETSEDVHTRMQAIQENEIVQLRELTTFLDTQFNFARQYFEILQDVKANWCNEKLGQFEHMKTISRTRTPPHADDNQFHTIRSKRSTLSTRSAALPSSSPDPEDDAIGRTPSRRKSDAEIKPTPLSRSTSRASRQRSDSNITAGTPAESAKLSKRMNVTGWASNAVSSIAGRGKKDRENFAALLNDDEEKADTDPPNFTRSPSLKSLSKKSPKVKPADLSVESSPRTTGRILKPPSQQEKKLVKALYDFNGSSDELPFKAGDEITVIHEVLDDWWLGMLKDGRKGLFPTTYTEPVSRPPTSSNFRSSPFEPEHIDGLSDDTRHRTRHNDVTDDDESIHNYMRMEPPNSATSFGFDVQSMTSAVEEMRKERHLMPIKQADFPKLLVGISFLFYHPPCRVKGQAQKLRGEDRRHPLRLVGRRPLSHHHPYPNVLLSKIARRQTIHHLHPDTRPQHRLSIAL
ncbi:BAR-domain-containing protein [Melanogaster broomeanus]|nr:BAR-domain-containing protein [Melanogaster broomeanus]